MNCIRSIISHSPTKNSKMKMIADSRRRVILCDSSSPRAPHLPHPPLEVKKLRRWLKLLTWAGHNFSVRCPNFRPNFNLYYWNCIVCGSISDFFYHILSILIQPENSPNIHAIASHLASHSRPVRRYIQESNPANEHVQ